jgi:hypothetical protein
MRTSHRQSKRSSKTLQLPDSAVAERDAGELIRTEEDKRKWVLEKKRWLEEIENYLVSIWPSTGAAEKKNKVDALEYAFGTRSWSAIERCAGRSRGRIRKRIQEFAQQKIAEAKGELPPEPLLNKIRKRSSEIQSLKNQSKPAKVQPKSGK